MTSKQFRKVTSETFVIVRQSHLRRDYTPAGIRAAGRRRSSTKTLNFPPSRVAGDLRVHSSREDQWEGGLGASSDLSSAAMRPFGPVP